MCQKACLFGINIDNDVFTGLNNQGVLLGCDKFPLKIRMTEHLDLLPETIKKVC